MSKQLAMKIVKRTIGFAILGYLFVFLPIQMARNESNKLGQFIGLFWLGIWLLVGLIILLIWLFNDD